MRLKIRLNSDKEYIALPIHHNYLLQSMLYKNLPKQLANFLHDVGFSYEKRSFKLFTFSKIQSEHFKISNQQIIYKAPISIYISSAVNDITKNWGETFIRKEYFLLGSNELFLESIEVITNPDFKDKMTIKTLSPITTYRTFEKDKKYYRYYSPTETDFQELIKENLRKKYEVISGEKIPDFPLKIKPIKTRKLLLKYKDFPIEAYEGTFEINTQPNLFKTVYDAGLGAKNSQGFGMIEVT
ncbi:CRISPR-associated endoribonuclease Cas6 [Sulfurihydrogenibium sp.]|uniref:CRISPR-associated endoribonuclease Cas6 n=1 Tax=Sulfurihydrogenibium sp. TaxID=2053621 RepID=UPI002624F856|nr:CRISPR-associated endoribonuclease Cas6 [Sulfurihydrogenibium sp.]